MGFGFVEFERREDAIKAVKSLQVYHSVYVLIIMGQNKNIDEHSIILKLSVKGQNQEKTKQRKITQQLPETTKIIIRNVAFEAKKQDIRDLCKVNCLFFTILY